MTCIPLSPPICSCRGLLYHKQIASSTIYRVCFDTYILHLVYSIGPRMFLQRLFLCVLPLIFFPEKFFCGCISLRPQQTDDAGTEYCGEEALPVKIRPKRPYSSPASLLSAAVPAPRFPALSHAGPVFQIPIPSFFLPVFSHNKRDRRSVPFSSAFLLLPHERHTTKSASFP